MDTAFRILRLENREQNAPQAFPALDPPLLVPLPQSLRFELKRYSQQDDFFWIDLQIFTELDRAVYGYLV